MRTALILVLRLAAPLPLLLTTACAKDNLSLASESIEQGRYEAAVDYLKMGASEGDERCDYALATLLLSGEGGVERDASAGSARLRTAAEAGLPSAQAYLGLLYETGEGVERDPMAAAGWYRKAADAGLPGAQSHLGFLYERGEGVEKSPEFAAKWYRKAAKYGDPLGQAALGAAYFNGNGVPRDPVDAYMWTLLAARQGNSEARSNLGVIRKELSKGQLSRATKKASEFQTEQTRTRPLRTGVQRYDTSDSLRQRGGFVH